MNSTSGRPQLAIDLLQLLLRRSTFLFGLSTPSTTEEAAAAQHVLSPKYARACPPPTCVKGEPLPPPRLLRQSVTVSLEMPQGAGLATSAGVGAAGALCCCATAAAAAAVAAAASDEAGGAQRQRRRHGGDHRAASPIATAAAALGSGSSALLKAAVRVASPRGLRSFFALPAAAVEGTDADAGAGAKPAVCEASERLKPQEVVSVQQQ
jgi:hypothetical protein